MKYYFGIYIDYTEDDRPRIAQVMESVDNLSCEMLANPGLLTLYSADRSVAKKHFKSIAKQYDCKFIEFGWGKYKLIKIS